MTSEFMPSIRGWLTQAEAKKLSELAKDKMVLELGAYCGKSTIALATTASLVHTVDWFKGDEGTIAASGKQEDTLNEFRANLRSLSLEEKVVIHVGDIERLKYFLPHSYFDLVFIDSAHDKEAVARDTKIALRCMLPMRAVVAFHDWNYESVRQGAHEVMSAYLGPRKYGGVVDSLCWWVF